MISNRRRNVKSEACCGEINKCKQCAASVIQPAGWRLQKASSLRKQFWRSGRKASYWRWRMRRLHLSRPAAGENLTRRKLAKAVARRPRQLISLAGWAIPWRLRRLAQAASAAKKAWRPMAAEIESYIAKAAGWLSAGWREISRQQTRKLAVVAAKYNGWRSAMSVAKWLKACWHHLYSIRKLMAIKRNSARKRNGVNGNMFWKPAWPASENGIS